MVARPRVPEASSEATRHVMQANRSKNTSPALRVRAALRAAGYDGALTAEMNPYPGYPTAMAEQTSRAMDILLAAAGEG